MSKEESGFYLMTDGFQRYNKVKNVNRCTCWVHIRRYLLEAISKGQDKDYSNPAV
nr:transposase [uncultured Sellimonas sp.]